jgi:hypothetical protein
VGGWRVRECSRISQSQHQQAGRRNLSGLAVGCDAVSSLTPSVGPRDWAAYAANRAVPSLIKAFLSLALLVHCRRILHCTAHACKQRRSRAPAGEGLEVPRPALVMAADRANVFIIA